MAAGRHLKCTLPGWPTFQAGWQNQLLLKWTDLFSARGEPNLALGSSTLGRFGGLVPETPVQGGLRAVF